MSRLDSKVLLMIQLAHGAAELTASKFAGVGAVVFDPEVNACAFGYNGVGSGENHELSHGSTEIPSGETHAEVNALMKVQGCRRRSMVMYLTREPCETCAAYILNHKGVGIVAYAGNRGMLGKGAMRLHKAGVEVVSMLTNETPQGRHTLVGRIAALRNKNMRTDGGLS